MPAKKKHPQNKNAVKSHSKKDLEVIAEEAHAKTDLCHAAKLMSPKSKDKEGKSPYSKKMVVSPDISHIVKDSDYPVFEEEGEVSFDPPFHSTAVYTDVDEFPLTSGSKEERRSSASSKSKTAESTPQRPPEKTRKNQNKAESQMLRTESSKINDFPENMDVEEPHTSQEPGKVNKSRRKPNKGKASQKAEPHMQSTECSDFMSSKKVVLEASSTPEAPAKATKSRRKSNQAMSSSKTEYQVQRAESSHSDSLEKIVARSTSQTPAKANKHRRKPNQGMISNKVQSQVQRTESSDIDSVEKMVTPRTSQVSGKADRNRRKSNKNLNPEKADSQVQISEHSNIDSSEKMDREAPGSSEAHAKAIRSRREPNTGMVLHKTKTRQGKRKKSQTKDSSRSGSDKTAPFKVWSSEEVPRTSRNCNELDVVLFDFEKIVTDYRETIDSAACKRKVDTFFDSLKEQLITTIEDSQQLKNLKRKNAKMQSEIGRKRKHLIEVRDELIQNGSKLKQLQKEYAELQEKQSSMANAQKFLASLRDLQENYIKYKEGHPDIKETYGISSLPALLLQSEPVLRAERHFQKINTKLQHILDKEESSVPK
ncbi:centromere protein U [Rhinophrynus dorsalis]